MFSPTVPLADIVNAILFKLKTGVQWRQLPAKALFENQVLENCWIEFLKRHKSSFDLSSVDLDRIHTPTIRGGASVEYQGRKKHKTTNALYLTDRIEIL